MSVSEVSSLWCGNYVCGTMRLVVCSVVTGSLPVVPGIVPALMDPTVFCLACIAFGMANYCSVLSTSSLVLLTMLYIAVGDY